MRAPISHLCFLFCILHLLSIPQHHLGRKYIIIATSYTPRLSFFIVCISFEHGNTVSPEAVNTSLYHYYELVHLLLVQSSLHQSMECPLHCFPASAWRWLVRRRSCEIGGSLYYLIETNVKPLLVCFGFARC